MFIRSWLEQFPCFQSQFQREVVGSFRVADSDSELAAEITKFMQACSEQAKHEDPSRYIQKIAEKMPLQRLEAILEIDGDRALQEAKAMLSSAKKYLKTFDHSHPISVQAAVNGIIDTISAGLDSIVNAFGIASFFKNSRNEYENGFKSQIIVSLISTCTLLAATLIPVLGPDLAFPILGGLFLFIYQSLFLHYFSKELILGLNAKA